MIRNDYWERSDPEHLRRARWVMVALAASVPLGSALTNIITGVLLLAILIAGGFAEHWRTIRGNPFALASVILFLLILVGVTWSGEVSEETSRIVQKHSRLLLVAFAVALMAPREWRERAMVAWLLSMAVTLALSYLHSVWAFPLARATREAVFDDHYIFKHHITQNVMMSVFAAAVLCLGIRANNQGRRTEAFAWFALTAAASVNVLFFVAGRTGYLTLIAALLVVAFALAHGFKRWILLAGVALALGGLALSSEAVKERMRTAVEEAQAHDGTHKTSIGMRVEFAQKSLSLIAERPILGFGTGSYSREYCRVASTVQWCAVGSYNPHNQFLYFGVQLGMIGMLALLAWIVCAAYTFSHTKPLDRAMGFALLVTFTIHSLLDSPLYVMTEGVWYPLGLGLLAAGYVGQRNAQPDSSNPRA